MLETMFHSFVREEAVLKDVTGEGGVDVLVLSSIFELNEASNGMGRIL